MGIDAKHPAFEEAEDMWDICEAFVEGERSVKDEGEDYLPRLSGQTRSEYEAYKERAIFFAAASKTCSGLLGAVFYKKPEVALPERIAYLENKATTDNETLSDLAVKLVKELLITGRAGLLVERPADGGAPYLVAYDADDICNWVKDAEDEFIVLEEDIYVRDPDDKYNIQEKEQYRELTIDQNGQYVVNIWQEVKDVKTKKESWQIVDTVIPTKNGRAIGYIPFVCITPDGLTFDVVKPPLYDLVSVNLQHYRVAADLANAIHTICMPTPWIAADLTQEDGKTITFPLGVTNAWLLPQGSNVGFLELQGQGLQPVENTLNRLEEMAVNLGARFVSQSKISTGVETAKGSEIRENQATEILSSILIAVESGIETALRIAADWESANPDEVAFKINKDLIKTNLDANMLNALTKALMDGAISPETYYKNLEEGNFYATNSTFDREQAAIVSASNAKQTIAQPQANSQIPAQGA